MTTPRPLIVAHRGASHDAPENTLAAFRLAWEMSADAAETDVFLTADGHVVCLHDPTTDRTTGYSGRVGEMTLEELQALDAGSWKSRRFAGERIPTLAEALETMPDDGLFYVEIKDTRRAVAPVLETIDATGTRERVVLMSFDWDVCEELVRAAPDVPVLWIIDAERGALGRFESIPPRTAQQARDAGFAGINVRHQGADEALAEASREAGVSLSVWTVNDVRSARRTAALGVEAITTDRPDVMLRAFGGD